MSQDHSRYSRLANITKMINMKLDLREVMEQVTLAISEEIMRCDSVGIYLPQPDGTFRGCLLYTSPSPRDRQKSRMPSSA